MRVPQQIDKKITSHGLRPVILGAPLDLGPTW
jgi:hypothetical protein